MFCDDNKRLKRVWCIDQPYIIVRKLLLYLMTNFLSVSAVALVVC